MKKIFLIILFVFTPKISYSIAEDDILNQDFVTWTRAGINIESKKSPLSFQVDQQLRINSNISKFQSVQGRFFGHYKNNNNQFSLAYILTTLSDLGINNVFAFQYLNDWEFYKNSNFETRFRLEKRYQSSEGKTQESWRGRVRGGFDYIINNFVKMVVNDEVFFTENRGFTENRVQAGFTISFNKQTSLDLFYQNRFLRLDVIEHTLFTNLNYKISLD